jgi:hypothetical protein
LVACLFWVQNVAGSNPVIPTYPFFSMERERNERSFYIDLNRTSNN